MNEDTPAIKDQPTSGEPSQAPDAGGGAAPKKRRSKATKTAEQKAAVAATEARIG
jgi:ribonuclease-3